MNAHVNPDRVDFDDVRAAVMRDPGRIIDELIPDSSRGETKGDELWCCNPTRADTNPTSFSINTKTGCFFDLNGSKQGGDIFELWRLVKGLPDIRSAFISIAEFLSVPPRATLHDFNEPLRQKETKKEKQPLGPIIKIYNYTDIEGTIFYQVTRHDPKAFRQRRPNGGWIWNLDGVKHVLYRWPEIAKYPDAAVFFCEGEKDADRVASLGHCATTITASTLWTDNDELAGALAGRNVFILEDNDPGGNDRALAAAMALHGKAATIRYVRFPGLVAKGDVSDWLDADPANAERLVDFCVGVPEWVPPTKDKEEKGPDEQSGAEENPAKEEGPTTPVIHATPYVFTDPASIPMRQWLYGKHLLRKFVTGTISPGGIGKSSLVTGEALAMVSGKDLLDISPPACLRVWLWNLEDPLEETTRKIQAAALHYELEPDDIGDRLMVDSGREQRLVIATATRNGAVIVQPVVDSLVEQIIKHKIDVIIIDPFVSCHEVAENDNGAMDMVVKEWGRVADRGNCAVHLVHHTRKMGGAGGESEVTADSSRGGSSQTDGWRAVRTINRMTKEQANSLGIENPWLYFRTINGKPNLEPPADKSEWYKLVSVSLWNGPMGTEGDSIGVVTKWELPAALEGMTAADFQKVAMVIRGGKWRFDPQAKGWVGYAVAQALRLPDPAADKPTKGKIKRMLGAWYKAKSLVVVDGVDERRVVKQFVEVADED
jgi:hypothetical protein